MTEEFDVGGRLKTLRTQFGLSQRQLAETAGVPHGLDEFGPLLERMENEHIIITHLTHRTSVVEARKMLEKRLPGEVYKKVMILMDRKNWTKRSR